MKTNKEKNLAHDARVQAKVRPKPVDYEFEALEVVMRAWITRR
jgi:hypothetical protein